VYSGNRKSQIANRKFPVLLLHPLALAGLLALAGPLLIHLLVRREAARVRFPTLRFLRASPAASVRRHRLSDWPLLLVRLAVVALAAVAFADPVIVSLSRASARQRVSRAIVVDTSPSMTRGSATGQGTLLDDARSRAAAIRTGTTDATIVERVDLADGVPAACAWLERARPSRRELVALSDFQRSGFDPAVLECVPPDVRITLTRVAPRDASTPIRGERIVRGGRELVAEVTADSRSTAATYVPVGETTATPPIDIVGSAEEQRIASLAIAAVLVAGAPVTPPDRQVVVVLAGAAERAALDRAVGPIATEWMADVVRRLRGDPALRGAAGSADPRAGVAALACHERGCVPVVFGRSGAPLVEAAADRGRLVLFAHGDAQSMFMPALMHAVMSAAAPFSYGEREPNTWDDESLRRLERPGADPPATLFHNETTGSHRSLWVAVLMLLGLESWMRRTTPGAVPARTDVEARVA
jgi:aerotolerance regulator-like protein